MNLLFSRISKLILALSLSTVAVAAQAEDLRAQTAKMIVHVDTETGAATFISRKYDLKVTNKADDFKHLFQLGDKLYIVNRSDKMFLLDDDFEMNHLGTISRRVKAAATGLVLGGASLLAGNGFIDATALAFVGALAVRFNLKTTPYYGVFLTQVSHVRGPNGQNDAISKIEIVEDRVVNPVVHLVTLEKTYDLADFSEFGKCEQFLAGPYSVDVK